MADEFERWPGRERRDMPRSSATWVVRSALAHGLRIEAGREPVSILDQFGCGILDNIDADV